jgi:hypothetical protein
MGREERKGAGRRVGGTPTLLGDACDIYESSYRVMGDNLGGGEQRATG